MIPIEKISEISRYINRYGAVSNFEIAYLALDKNIECGLADERVKFFMQIFLNKPQNIMLPHLPYRVNFREEALRYSVKPSTQCLINAYRRAAKLKREATTKIILKFLSSAGYSAFSAKDEIFAEKEDKGLNIKVCGSIEELRMNFDYDIKKYGVMALPSGNNLQPFMDFYKKYADGIVKLGGTVWNVDLWSAEVSPFIRIPEPEMMREFEKCFGKPRLASAINQLWQRDDYEKPAVEFKSGDNNISIKIGRVEFG